MVAAKRINILEFQKRGAVQYHLAVNMFIAQHELSDIWGQGFVWIERKITTQQQLANYISKYLTKNANDDRLKGYHSYLYSQGLKVEHKDQYFKSKQDMLEHLEKTYGECMKNK